NFISRLVPYRRPSKLFVALDADWRPQFRVDAMPSYKSHRVAGPDDPPDPVDPQMKIIIELLDAFGISVAAADGYEAEDVIATIAERTTGPIEIVTGDRDLFALVKDPNVRVLYTLRGVSELGQVDEAYIRNKYGVPGDRYFDYAVLRGDPSDGLPGVHGIGEKTASHLVAKYGSLDAILVSWVVDIAGSNVFAIVYFGALVAVGRLTLTQLGSPDFPNIVLNDPVMFATSMAGGTFFSVLAGYVAARMAGRAPLLHGTLSSAACLGSDLLSL